jgi:hypothetical protein
MLDGGAIFRCVGLRTRWHIWTSCIQVDRMRLNAEGLHSVGKVVGHLLQGHNVVERKPEGISLCGLDSFKGLS